MLSVAGALHIDGYADHVAQALERLRLDDIRSYPREAHHAHLVASALARSGHEPILETDYWQLQYADEPGRGSRKRPRADLWCHAAFGDEHRDLFVEIKLAGLWNARQGIGLRPVADIVPSWAEDVWRLLVGGRRSHAAFVLCCLGNADFSAWKPRAPGFDAVPHLGESAEADDVYRRLAAVTSNTALGAVVDFLSTCERRLPARVTYLPSASRGSIHVWPAVVEWKQDQPCASPWVV